MKTIWKSISKELRALGVEKNQGHYVAIVSLLWFITVVILERL